MRLFSIFPIFFVPAIYAAKTSQPPKPFENVGNESGIQGSEMTAAAAASQPPLFWNYYPNAEQGVSYTRSSPESWRGVADSSPLRGYYAAPRVAESETRRSDSDRILDLSYRPRISHGPRRRRRGRNSAERNSAKCRGLAVDCATQRNHICCQRKEGERQTVFQDPEFGIPLDQPPPDYVGAENRRANNAISAREDGKKKEVTKRRWTVGSSLIPLIPYAPNYRCPVDCGVHHRHPCCSPVDRFAPVEPYVQPSLLENWVTTLFIAFGSDPASYLLAKKAILVGVFILGLALWGWMGSSLGWLDGLPDAFSSRVGNELTNEVISAVDGQTWLKELSAREAVRGGSSTINRFVCCFQEAGEGEGGEGGDGGRGIRCFQRPKKRRQGPDEDEMSVLDCVSKLAYEVTMNSTQDETLG